MVVVETGANHQALEHVLQVVEPIDARFKSDFNLGLYDTDQVSLAQVETHVRAFLGEKLLKPRSEELWVGIDGQLDPDYAKMMRRSVAYWRDRGDESAATRFERELEGAKNAVELIINSSALGDPLPIVINASDPGTFYVDEQGIRKSVTFVWMLEQAVEGGWRYKVLSLPTRHIGLERHGEVLQRLGDVQRTENILCASLDFQTAESMIAHPVILDEFLHSVEELALLLGYQSWDEVEEMAADQLALDKDHYAKERRVTMVDEFTRLIINYVLEGRSREEKEALVNAMSDIFALEAGARDFLGLNAEQIKVEISRTVRLALAEQQGVFEEKGYYHYNSSMDLGDLHELYAHRSWMINAFATNPLAQEARATGCGGSGISYTQTFAWGNSINPYLQPSYFGLETMNNNLLPTTLTSLEVSLQTHAITISLPSGVTYTLAEKESGACKNGCGRSTGIGSGVLMGPCMICDHCDPNVHRAD